MADELTMGPTLERPATPTLEAVWSYLEVGIPPAIAAILAERDQLREELRKATAEIARLQAVDHG